MTEHYESLGVDVNASKEEIEKSYKLLRKKYHPDNKETGDEEKFKKIQEAYETLSDPEKKEKYDNERWFVFKEEHESLFFKVLTEVISERNMEDLDRTNLVSDMKLKIDERVRHFNNKISQEKIRNNTYIKKMDKLESMMRSKDGKWQTIYKKLLENERVESSKKLDSVIKDCEYKLDLLKNARQLAETFECYVYKTYKNEELNQITEDELWNEKKLWLN